MGNVPSPIFTFDPAFSFLYATTPTRSRQHTIGYLWRAWLRSKTPPEAPVRKKDDKRVDRETRESRYSSCTAAVNLLVRYQACQVLNSVAKTINYAALYSLVLSVLTRIASPWFLICIMHSTQGTRVLGPRPLTKQKNSSQFMPCSR